MQMNKLLAAVILVLMTGCTAQKNDADLILTGGTIYTVDEDFSVAEAVAIKNGRIEAVGSSREILRRFRAREVTDLEGNFVYPGWIDAHCHFFGYGMNFSSADLVGTASPEEVIEKLKEHHERQGGTWITGRGWDQNDWDVKQFPDRRMLDQHFPEIPVLLRRIDGHAAWVNTRALEMAGITAESRVEGGDVLLEAGTPTGILVDNAISLVSRLIPPPTKKEMIVALRQAEKNCFSVGLTSVQDAGLDKETVELIDSLYRAGTLQIRMNAWLSATEENFDHFVEQGPLQNEFLSVNTVKLFADGALGSRGARMLEPYSDDPGNLGLYVTGRERLESFCRRAHAHHFAVATHAIGDAANRTMLEMYADILEGKNDRRWRIEHAQIIAPEDFQMFGDYSIIPSVQPTHATSDMYWAEDRIGPQRMKGAYAFHSLLIQNGWIANGSDFPVESINPLFGFYAAVARKDQSGYPEGRFIPEEAISREDALRAMTIWAARAGFEEHLKGSIEPGKLADLVVTGTDLMTAPEEELFGIQVQTTYSGGAPVFHRSP
jgi:predicted amidohydrolase YtcJ